MNHLHFETINSTQLYLKENIETLLKNNSDILISCDFQTHGIGRSGNSWIHQPKSIAMSFTITPSLELTITPIEIGIATILFFRETFNQTLFLKWPNDLMSISRKKVGGIITHFHNNDNLIAGLGINLDLLSNQANDQFRYGIDALNLQTDLTVKQISELLYKYILKNRIDVNQVVNFFNKHCLHMNKAVKIEDHQITTEGICRGINQMGALLIESQKEIQPFISGSLTLTDY